MYCPNCGAQSNGADRFCGSCGSALDQQAPQDAGESTGRPPEGQVPEGASYSVAPQPTVPQPAASQPAAPQPAPTQPATVQSPAMQSAPVAELPPARSGSGVKILLITVVIVAVVGVGGLATAGFLAWRAFSEDPVVVVEEASPVQTSEPAPTGVADEEPVATAEPVGFAAPEAAAMEEYPDDWVYDILVDEGSYLEYVVGPPNSEYIDVVVVEQHSDGSWALTDVYAFEMGDIDGGEGEFLPEEEAMWVVEVFLAAIQEDRPMDAHALTVEPFSDDPASAQYSNGDLVSFQVIDAQIQSDGSMIRVTSSETWAWGTERWVYVCVPTEAGYRITGLLMP